MCMRILPALHAFCVLLIIICWKGQENNVDVRLCRCAHVRMSKMNSQSKNLTTGTTPDLNRHMWQGSDLNGNRSTNVFNTAPTNIHILHVRTCARPLRILPYAGRSCPLFQYNFFSINTNKSSQNNCYYYLQVDHKN